MNTTSAAGPASTAMNAVIGSDRNNIRVRPCSVILAICSSSSLAVASVSRGMRATITERKNTDPPIAEISR